MLPVLLGKIGLPVLLRTVTGALDTLSSPAAKTASDTLKDVQRHIANGSISPEDMQEANRHIERMTEIESAEAKTALQQINESLRAEVASQDAYVRRMRPTFGYIMAVTRAAQMLAIAFVILDEPEKAGHVMRAMADLDTIWTVGLSVLGIYVYKRSQEKKKGKENKMNLLDDLRTKFSEAFFDAASSNKNSLTGKTTDHYRRGEGKPLEIDPIDLRKSTLIKKATEKNQDRLLDTLKSDKNLYKKLPDGTLQKVSLSTLKDNDSIILDDYFDSDENSDIDFITNPDIKSSLGSFKLRSKSNLEFKKAGKKLLPYGHVRHSVNDTYDFNPGTIDRIIAEPLEKTGKGKPYPISSEWISRPYGVISIDGASIDTSKIQWE